MRVALITAQPNEDHGHEDQRQAGRLSQVTGLARTLAAHGHEPTIYAPSAEGDAMTEDMAIPGVDWCTYREDEPAAAEVSVRLGELLSDTWTDDPPDIAHAFGSGAGVAVTSVDDDTIPLVQDLRPAVDTSPLVDADGDGVTRLEAALGRRADRTVVADRQHADWLADHGVPRDRMFEVPYGVDLDQYRPGGRAGGGQRIICAGGCEDRVVSDLVGALASIPEVELLVTGTGTTDRLDLEAKELAAMAESAGVQDRVRLLAGVGDEERVEAYRSADIMVTGSSWAMSGAACLQAMAAGTPVVACAVDGSADIVVDRINGLVVAPGRVDQLVEALHTLLSHPTRRVAYGLAGADLAACCYGFDRVTSFTESVYTGALATAGDPVG